MAALESERARQRQAQVKLISFDEMWTYVGVRWGEERNRRRIWTAITEDPEGNRWKDFEVGDRSEDAFACLYERLPDTAKYRSDDYAVYGCLSRNKRKVGKGSEVNRNEGYRSVLRGKLNRLVRSARGAERRMGC